MKARKGSSELNSIDGFYFDTSVALCADLPEPLLEEALTRCEAYEKLLSRFAPESDVWRINHAEGAPVAVNDDTMRILKCAEELRRASGGAFNTAVGSILELWDFSGNTTVVPDEAALEQARARMEAAELVIEGNQVRVPKGTTLDLGGIAKGYICERIAEYLREAGARSGLLNFGGNVATIGVHPLGRPWQVGLQNPRAERNQEVFAVVESSDSSVITSGVYERAFVLDGTIYHHILDPRTCYPAESTVISATVVLADGMVADALATTLLILGAEQGFSLVRSYGAEALVLDAQEHVSATKDFPLLAR
ncbi:MAG: FAD:protein FMN transferase [Coriobacteriales bacterium]|nr:FAD:protein FMN transferase [Coriobacteriales bacterium]